MAPLDPSRPDPETIARYITETFAEADVVTARGARFFSLDPDSHWPNFATIVTTDDFDEASNLARPGVFRLNIGLGRQTFERLVGNDTEPDFTAFDRILPHPVYARQLWVSILNPTATTFDAIVKPLLAEAHQRLAAQRARHATPADERQAD